MLVRIALKNLNLRDPILDLIAKINGNSGEVREISRGLYECGHWNFDGLLKNVAVIEDYPELDITCKVYDQEDDEEYETTLNAYGVCDSPAQFKIKVGNKLIHSKKKYVVSFVHIKKDPENAGKGGGWRWHKWGPYIGECNHEYEYLDDEDGFENGVWTYHIYEILDLL